MTLSPLEPSEAMVLSKEDVINAGVIFFAITIASTLVLGRWFCGWACHLVALQDLCRWLLARLRIRPRPLRSTILGIVPLLAFLYMFVAPWIYRALANDAFETPRLELTTSDFWATFPTWAPALLTFVTCGFVAVYLLGAKGFCATACPYGGIFGVADQVAPMRIRVTNACEGCGHCTAVCTSNVRVHEEVRDFRMVVDPGCMKCLDCVSVCPKHALYVGWGMPAIGLGGAAGAAAGVARTGGARVDRRGRLALRALFVFGALLAFTGFDRAFAYQWADFVVTAALGGMALLVAQLFRSRSNPPKRPLSLADETTLAAGFLLALLISRDLAGMVGFLFSLGLAAAATFLLLEGVRLLRSNDQSLHGFRLKRGGRLLPAGRLFAVLLGALATAGAWGGVQQSRQMQERRWIGRQHAVEAALRRGPTPAVLLEAAAVYSRRVAKRPDDIEGYLNLGMAQTALQRFDDAQKTYERALSRAPRDARVLLNVGVLAAQRGDVAAALPYFEAAVSASPDLVEGRIALGRGLAVLQRWDESEEQYRIARDAHPQLSDAWLGLILAQANQGDVEEARATVRAALQRFPTLPELRQLMQQLERP